MDFPPNSSSSTVLSRRMLKEAEDRALYLYENPPIADSRVERIENTLIDLTTEDGTAPRPR